MVNFLIILYFIVGLVFGSSGVITYWALGKAEDWLPGKTQAQRVKREEVIVKCTEARKKMLPWVAVAFVAWPVNFIYSAVRRIMYSRSSTR